MRYHHRHHRMNTIHHHQFFRNSNSNYRGGSTNPKGVFGFFIFFIIIIVFMTSKLAFTSTFFFIPIVAFIFIFISIVKKSSTSYDSTKVNVEDLNTNDNSISKENEFKNYVIRVFKEKFPNDLILTNFSISNNLRVDFMIFSTKGIFVININDFKGSIYGSVTDDDWTIEKTNESVLNPMINVNRIIDELNIIHPFKYRGIVILSNESDLAFNSEDVIKFDDFLSMYDEALEKYFEHEIRNCYNAIFNKNNYNF